MGKVHQRISDTNKRRKLQFGQATMLGIAIIQAEHRPTAPWKFALPDHLQPASVGYASGYFRRRWECVEAALRVLGVVA